MSSDLPNAEELIPTRDSLLSRLKDRHDDESWRDFFNTYWKLIYGVARKAGMTDAMLAELMAVVGMANETNRLASGYQVEIDEQFETRGKTRKEP